MKPKHNLSMSARTEPLLWERGLVVAKTSHRGIAEPVASLGQLGAGGHARFVKELAAAAAAAIAGCRRPSVEDVAESEPTSAPLPSTEVATGARTPGQGA